MPRCRIFGRFAEIVPPAVTTPSLRSTIESINAARVAVLKRGRKAKKGSASEEDSRSQNIQMLDRLRNFYTTLMDVYFELAEVLQSRIEDVDRAEIPITSCLVTKSLVKRLTRYEEDQPVHRVSCVTLFRAFEAADAILKKYLLSSPLAKTLMQNGVKGMDGNHVTGIDALKLSTSRLMENIMARLHALPSVADIAQYNGGVDESWRDSAKRFVETEMAFEIVLEEYRSWNLRNGLLDDFVAPSAKSVEVRMPVSLGGSGHLKGAPSEDAETPSSLSAGKRGYFNIRLHDLKGVLDAFMELDPEQTGRLGSAQFAETLTKCSVLRNDGIPIVSEPLAKAVIESFRTSINWDEEVDKEQVSVDYVQFWSQLYERVALVLSGESFPGLLIVG